MAALPDSPIITPQHSAPSAVRIPRGDHPAPLPTIWGIASFLCHLWALRGFTLSKVQVAPGPPRSTPAELVCRLCHFKHDLRKMTGAYTPSASGNGLCAQIICQRHSISTITSASLSLSVWNTEGGAADRSCHYLSGLFSWKTFAPQSMKYPAAALAFPWETRPCTVFSFECDRERLPRKQFHYNRAASLGTQDRWPMA